MNINPPTMANTTASAAAAVAGTGAGTKVTSDYQTFLVMLTAQMQNQDPLNPIEASDFAVQLATFSGVEQQVKTNDLLNNLVAQMGLMGMAQLAGWVGMEARAAAPAWFDGNPVTLAPRPPAAAQETTLVVSDAAGRVVSRRAIQPSSELLGWTGITETGGQLGPGLYSFRLESFQNGQLIANDAIEVYSPIVEARVENGATVLILEGGARVPSSAVTALRQPQTY